MDLPIKFPNDADVIAEEAARFRALSPRDRVRAVGRRFWRRARRVMRHFAEPLSFCGNTRCSRKNSIGKLSRSSSPAIRPSVSNIDMEIILPVIGVSFAIWCVWAVVRVVNEPLRWRTYLGPIGVIMGLALVAGLFLPAVTRSREPARRSQCKTNLKQIGLALHQYHDKYGCFPPAYIADPEGRPMHSWRVLLLPYLDQMPLYKEYRFNEPWDGPNNSKLADKVPTVFYCPSESHGRIENVTSYVAVVGPGTIWPGSRSTKIADIRDGTSNTLMVVEIADSGIHWMEPRDLSSSQMAPTINAKSSQGISSPHIGCAHAVFADGMVRPISNQVAAGVIRALLTINGNDNQSICDDF